MKNLNNKSNKIKFISLSIQLLSYIFFLFSHFLVWGSYYIYFIYPVIPFPFIGLDSIAGQISIILLNIGFIFSYLINILFFFKLDRKKYNKKYAIIYDISIIFCLSVFIISVIGVFIFLNVGLFIYELLFGFFLWLSASIIMIGVLFYIKIKELPQINATKGL